MDIKLPTVMIRPDDGEVFSINSDGTYSSELMKRDFPKSLDMKFNIITLKAYGFIPGYNDVDSYLESKKL